MENILTKIGVFLLGGIIGYLFYLDVGENALEVLYWLVCIASGLLSLIIPMIHKNFKKTMEDKA